MGLAIVRYIVEMHGGTVQVHSAGANMGATFTVSLPRIAADSRNSVSSAVDSERDADWVCPPELHGLRVLVVDDQPDILEVLHDMLVQCGAVVRTCDSAIEALATLREWQPEVLVSDIAMPGKDGYWLIENLRALPQEQGGAIPAVALTAYVRVQDRTRVLAAGFEMYVPKPVDRVELLNVIANLVKRQRTEDE